MRFGDREGAESPSLVGSFPPNFWPPWTIDLKRWISSVGAQALQPRPRLGPRCLESTLASRLELAKVVPAWVSFGITTYLGLCGPTGHQSSMDIDMTRVTRRGPRIPIVLGVPRGTEDQSYVPTGAHVERVRERARDWVEDEVRAKASWRATRSDRGEP
ncbi:hypothetical protein E5676_scaffold93G00050 [Cucumis melo var. makuwa]|uniref:Uncharacterized protein n=1 Tax=Cucumis melo var. makuwa TaxID=1194695 RepID=A0A5D3DWN1_CUCMM|nr:hypothetical protein E5676_scaffold93G00050 [Cucumis melo var. makuwa]